MLMLGTGHGEEEGTIEHALMLLQLMMRHSDFALMFTQQVRSFLAAAISSSFNHIIQARLTSLTALLLPSAATSATIQAALSALHEQCRTISAIQQSASADFYPLKYISDSVLLSAKASSRLFASAAGVLLCCARMQQHPDNPALLSLLADSASSFSTSIAIASINYFVLHQGQRNASSSRAGPCPHAEEELMTLGHLAQQQIDAASAVALVPASTRLLVGTTVLASY
jgi:hypothetical protein